MRKARSTLIALTFSLTTLATSGCGGASMGIVPAHVGGTQITRAELSHWMSTLAGGDFYEVSHHQTVPADLVSEPANYGRCVSRLEAAARAAGATAGSGPAPLLDKCRQLHQALKAQAMAFLVEANWIIRLDAALGIRASRQEVMQLFGKIKSEEFHADEAQLRAYLQKTRRTLADELFVVKLDVLRQKTQEQMTASGKQGITRFVDAAQTVTTSISCAQGYVVQHCKEYKGTPPSTASGAVLLEQVAALTGRKCINRAACG